MERAEVLIERFFAEGLTAAEQQELDALLQADDALREQFAFEKNLKTAVQEVEFDRLSEKMNALEDQLAEKESQPMHTIGERKQTAKTRSLLPKLMRVAAVFIGLLALSYFALQKLPGDTTQLAQNYYESYPNISYNIKRGQRVASKEALAFTAYEEEDFENAAKYFSAIAEEDRKDFIWFYLANSQFELKQYEKAIGNYDVSIEKKAFIPESQWYKALAYLNIKEKEKAKAELNALLTNHDYKQAEAKKLLKRIR